MQVASFKYPCSHCLLKCISSLPGASSREQIFVLRSARRHRLRHSGILLQLLSLMDSLPLYTSIHGENYTYSGASSEVFLTHWYHPCIELLFIYYLCPDIIIRSAQSSDYNSHPENFYRHFYSRAVWSTGIKTLVMKVNKATCHYRHLLHIFLQAIMYNTGCLFCFVFWMSREWRQIHPAFKSGSLCFKLAICDLIGQDQCYCEVWMGPQSAVESTALLITEITRFKCNVSTWDQKIMGSSYMWVQQPAYRKRNAVLKLSVFLFVWVIFVWLWRVH